MIGFKHIQRLTGVMVVVALVLGVMIAPVKASVSAQESISFNFDRMIFSPANTSSRSFSNIRVAAGDVTGDGSVEISFDLTVTGRDGTSNTVGIIAILIGMVRERGQSSYLTYQLENVLISSVVAGNMIGTDARAQAVANAAGRSVTSAFNRYVRSLVRDIDQPFRMEQTADGILIAMLLPE